MLQRKPQPHIQLQKATKARQTSLCSRPKIQTCTEPLLSKLPLFENFQPRHWRGFFCALAKVKPL